MQTLNRPPTKIQTREKNKKYYTLHRIPNHVMAWNAKTEKRAVVAFNREQDILSTGKIIENHYNLRREWPSFEAELIFDSGPIPKSVFDDELTMLNIVEWRKFDDLRVFCAEHYFDLIVVETMSKQFQLQGTIFRLDIPMEFFIPQLEKLLFDDWTES